MKKIEGSPKNIRNLFQGAKYNIHYYQREYQWRRKNIEELIDDLVGEFFDQYKKGDGLEKVQNYGHYFMGSIVLTQEDFAIIDGQQRLTSITLLLMYLYHRMTEQRHKMDVGSLFYGYKSGRDSFTIDVPERNPVMTAIYDDVEFDITDQPESVATIYNRWNDLKEIMDDKFADMKHALVHFKDWIISNVDFIRIETKTEQDAHKIFVSMNDRGLSLTSTEMLKGYLLSEIDHDQDRLEANQIWKETILGLKYIDKEGDSDFIKTWLRAQYSNSIRERKKGAKPKDFDIIGTTFHKWVRENHYLIGLVSPDAFYSIVKNDFQKFSTLYKLIVSKSESYDRDFRHIFYNSKINFTLQPMVLLAPIMVTDDAATINKKIKLTSCFLDLYVHRRIFNTKTIDYSAMTYTMWLIAKKIRRTSVDELYKLLVEEINNYEYQFDEVTRFNLSVWTKRYMQSILARLTSYIEVGSDMEDLYSAYTDWKSKNRYEVEHLIPDHYELQSETYDTEEEFDDYRNRFGSLVLLPKDKNASYNDLPYEDKVIQYLSENVLARSLNDKCYKNHPRFSKFRSEKDLDFKSYSHTSKEMLTERFDLYMTLVKQVWSIDELEKIYES